MRRVGRVLAAWVPLAVVLSACGGGSTADVPGGDATRGKSLLAASGCGGCHTIAGVPNADGRVGPPLAGLAGRAYIAGSLANTPENVIRWIVSPQTVAPATVMPSLGLTDRQARDITAYLYDH